MGMPYVYVPYCDDRKKMIAAQNCYDLCYLSKAHSEPYQIFKTAFLQ